MCTWLPLCQNGVVVIKFTKSRKMPRHLFQNFAYTQGTMSRKQSLVPGLWRRGTLRSMAPRGSLASLRGYGPATGYSSGGERETRGGASKGAEGGGKLAVAVRKGSHYQQVKTLTMQQHKFKAANKKKAGEQRLLPFRPFLCNGKNRLFLCT